MKTLKTKQPNKELTLQKVLIRLSLFVFFIKIIIIQNIEDGIWPGADAENYLNGLNGLIDQGIFSDSEKLTYWPAGYPLFIYLVSLVTQSYLLPVLAIIQSIVLSFSTYLFCNNLLRTKLQNYTFFIFLLISLNPTLALSPLTIGYETFAASGILFALSIVARDLSNKESSNFKLNMIMVSLIFGIISFFQPRLIVIGIFFIITWIKIRKKFRKNLILILVSLLIVLLIPSTLVFRNYKASGIPTISTNLGNTMMLGVGPGASGGYLSPKGSGVPCDTSGGPADVDKQLVLCAATWYLKNPGKTTELIFKKTLYFWSPWYGPAFNGTMARNPWLKINPIRSMTSNIDGAKLVFGDLGKAISYSWEFLTLLFLLYGWLILWRMRDFERYLGIFAGGTVLIAMATTWATLGDNRFRLPIMGMSLFLQAVGLRTLLKGGKPPMVDGPGLR